MNHAPFLSAAIFLFSILPATAAMLPPDVRMELRGATVEFKDGDLFVSTGVLERKWRWTGNGLATMGLRDIARKREWVSPQLAEGCDWTYPGFLDPREKGRLVSVTARIADDEGFTAEHLEVVTEVAYTRLTLRHVVWVYPGAPGLRVQLFARSNSPTPSSDSVPAAVSIRAIRGDAFTSAEALAHAPIWHASMLVDPQEIRFRIEGLDPARAYTLGWSWWDYGGGGRRQSVLVSSVDGELVLPILDNGELPSWRGKSEQPAEFARVIPAETYADGSVTVRVRLERGANATLGEIWLHGSDPRPQLGPADPSPRIRELSERGPEGSRLVAYLDAGAPGTEARAPVVPSAVGGRVDFLPVDVRDLEARGIGYFNDTQNRNRPDTPVLRDALVKGPECDWASILALRAPGAGLSIVKESHKCVNQSGIDTGLFRFHAGGIENTGWGLNPAAAASDRFDWCWATWIVVDDGTDSGREASIKIMDRFRYPINAERDLWSLVCTWGHSKNPRDGRNAATELEILRELPLTAELGADMLLIDDGWQVSLASKGFHPDAGIGWRPHPEVYPEGWRRVRAEADRLGLRLGLWGVAQSMPIVDMKWNFDRLKMAQLKLDFARFNHHADLDGMMRRAREFLLYNKGKCIMSWDTTENDARYGYWWAREYGNVKFMNRKPESPANVVYVPSLALRDFWQLSRYQNLNKWQLVIHNPEAIDRRHSDAWRYSPGYCVATALMGIPEFMAMPRYYSPSARAEVRALMVQWKKERDAIFHAFVFPIGEEPSGRSWTGFQAIHREGNTGHFLVFREADDQRDEHPVATRLPTGRKIRMTDLRGGETVEVTVGERGELRFPLPKAPDYGFYRYEILP